MDRLRQVVNSRLGAGVEGCHDLVTRRVPPDPEGGAGGGQEGGQHHRGPHHRHLSCVSRTRGETELATVMSIMSPEMRTVTFQDTAPGQHCTTFPGQ